MLHKSSRHLPCYVGPCNYGMGASVGCGWGRTASRYGGCLQIYWISSCRQQTKGWSCSLGVGQVVNNSSL